MSKTKIEKILNEICDEKGYPKIDSSSDDFFKLNLRTDMGFDSFDLAQLTVMVEDEFDIDIFEDGIVQTVEEIMKRLK